MNETQFRPSRLAFRPRMTPVLSHALLLVTLLSGALTGCANSSTVPPTSPPATPPTQTAPLTSIPLDSGGWFSGLSIHSSGRLYGYGDVFGVYRSDDAGNSWRYLQSDFTTDDNFVSGLGVATNNADLLAFRAPSRLWKSTDGGSSWSQMLGDLEDTNLVRGASPVLFHPDNDSEIWLAGNRKSLQGSLWRSVSGGASWQKVGGATFDNRTVTTVYVRSEFPDQVFVGTRGALFASANRGASWTRVWDNAAQPNPFTGQPPVVTAVVRRADGVGYVATDVGGYRLSASNWNDPTTYTMTKTVSWWNGWGPKHATVLQNGDFVTGGDGEGQNPTPSDLQDAQRISRDGGLTWTALGGGLNAAPTLVWANPAISGAKVGGGRDFLVQDPTRPERWFMTGGMSPVISDDAGQSWRYPPSNSGIAGVMTYKIRFPRDRPDLALIPTSDLGAFTATQTDGVKSSSNRSVARLYTTHEVMSSRNGQVLFTAGVDQVDNATMISRSSDGGATWRVITQSGNGLPPSSEGVTRAVQAPNNIDDFLVLLGSGAPNSNPSLWRTTNGGVSFTQATGVPAGLNTGTRYHPENAWLEADGVNTDTRYLSTREIGVYRSIDGGSSWAATASKPFGTDWVQCLAVDHRQAGRVWVAGGYRGLKVSKNGGDTWSDSPGFTQADRVDAHAGRVAVWGRRGADEWNKIYYSSDDGATWIEKTGVRQRFAFTKDITVDPVAAGQIWIGGISINIIR